MTASVSSPADVINVALRRIGYKMRVNNLFDGSQASNAALDIYAQTRDDVLRRMDWGFAQKFAAGALSGGTAPPPWTVEYAYPADCIRLRYMLNATLLADPNNPLPVLWTVGTANSARVIWSKIASATLVYTSQVTNPAQWDVNFVEAVAASLGRRLVALLPDLNAVKLVADDEAASIKTVEENPTG